MRIALSSEIVVSRPARKVRPEVRSQDRLLAYHEEKARELEAQIRLLEQEFAYIENAAEAAAARRRISRLSKIAADNRGHADRLRCAPGDSVP